MFFSISKQPKINFPVRIQIGEIWINLDEGWHQKNKNLFFKGYADFDNLNKNLQVSEGNFCIIRISDCIEIKGADCRSFPIFYCDNEITNLHQYPDSVSSNSKGKFTLDFKPFFETFNFIGLLENNNLSFDQCVNNIHQILSTKVEKFIQINTLPLKIFLTGGLDSMLVYSYIKKYTDDFELLNYQHFEYDYFWLENYQTIKQYWAYNQLHHWKEPCVLAVGTPGDEFMMRNPEYANLYLKHFKRSIKELLLSDKYRDCIHYDYFRKPKNMAVYEQQEIENKSFKNLQLLTYDILNRVCNDYQHWHLGQTLTYSPLRDINIVKTILQTEFDAVESQIMDGSITKALIALNDPSLINYICNKKNASNSLHFVSKLILNN
jgi:hypothetical protein